MDKIQERVTIEYLAPSSTEWKLIETDSTDKDKKEEARRNRSSLNELLLASMQMQNLVVLSGSGTSLAKSGGGPSMYGLWNLCTKNVSFEESDYLENATEIFDLIDYDVSDENKVNIEEFLSLCEAYLMIGKDTDGKIKTFVDLCKEKILEACNFSKKDDFLSAHKTFIHRLSRRRVRDSRLKVFTTNYDTCFEEAANAQGIVVIDGFSYTKPRQYNPRFFDYDIVRRSNNNSSPQNYLEGVFQLFKLHGSVNWERDKNGNIWEQDATPEGVCMIFPAKEKYQQSYIQPHLELMARYLAILREPNTCLVVSGFGFNDDHLSEPIIAAIKSNPYLKVIITDINAEANYSDTGNHVSKYWKELSQLSHSGYDIWFINSSFKEFSELIPDLQSLTPAEKLAQNIQKLGEKKS